MGKFSYDACRVTQWQNAVADAWGASACLHLPHSHHLLLSRLPPP